MPLPKRSVEPVHVSRSVYQQDELQFVELETITNTALTNIIRQLSSLSKHAEDIFGELARDVGNISNRANSLQARIDHLSIKVTQLDSSMEDVPLTDITRKKGFRSTKVFDQKIFSHSTMPAPMLETYTMCDKPPPLNILNNYRDDGKDGLKFYTDPNYFFELWRQEMLKDTERVMHDKGKKMNRPRQDGANSCINSAGNKKRVRKPHNTREKQRLIAIGHGETLMPNNINYQTPNSIVNMETAFGSVGVFESRQQRPNSIDLRNISNSELSSDDYYSSHVHTTTSNISALVTNAVNQKTVSPGENEKGITSMHLTQRAEQTLHAEHVCDDEIFGENQNFCEQSGFFISEGMGTSAINSRMKTRPSQPPPAPPSNGSRSGTPVSSNANTPTRIRNLSNNRDILPPPPPIPEGVINITSPRTLSVGNGNASTGISLQLPKNKSSILLHLDNNNFNTSNLTNMSRPPIYQDLALSPQAEHQHSKQKLANVAPPPPPPPPPLSQSEYISQGSVVDLTSTINGGIIKRISEEAIDKKKHLPPSYDSRTDLMKAIRDGITLRKVEKCEQKEIERNTALHDVASILARRVAIELSESEESDSDDDSEGWMESTENSA